MRLRIHLHLVATDQGGRQNPIWRGYRSGWETPNGSYHDAPILELSQEPLPPGSGAEADIYPIAPEFWGQVVIGDHLLMREGRKLVGRAEVLAIDTERMPAVHG